MKNLKHSDTEPLLLLSPELAAENQTEIDGKNHSIGVAQRSPLSGSNTVIAVVESEMLTVEDVATMLAIGVRSVWRKSQDGRLPAPIHIGGSTRWSKSELSKWITDKSTAAKNPRMDKRCR